MIIIYLLGLICVFSLLIPTTYIPIYVKWPVALAAVILITFLFNLCKKDSKFITKPTKSVVVKRGLYHPIIMYTSYVLYIAGFLGIFNICKVNEVTNIVEDYSVILANINNTFISSVIIIGVAVLLNNVFKWVFSKLADSTSIKQRSFLYVALVLVISIALVFNMINIDVNEFVAFLGTGHNYFVFYLIPAIMLVIDIVVTICSAIINHRKKKGIRDAKKAAKLAKKEAKEAKKAAKEKAKRDEKIAKADAKVAEKEAKRNEKLAVAQAKIDKKNAKKLAKANKKADKKSAKEARKDAKIDLKIAKIRTKNPKKADKLVAKYDKKYAKRARKEIRKAERQAIKQAEKDGKLNRKLAKKQAKLDKKEAKIQRELREIIADTTN